MCQTLNIIKNLQIDGVISFNYTNTFEQVYGKIFPNVKYDYIHGKAKLYGNVNNCNLVLGIDEYLQGEQRDKDNEFIQFKKFFQRIYKGTGSRYIDWLDDLNLLEDVDSRPDLNIYVYGHSLDVTEIQPPQLEIPVNTSFAGKFFICIAESSTSYPYGVLSLWVWSYFYMIFVKSI